MKMQISLSAEVKTSLVSQTVKDAQGKYGRLADFNNSIKRKPQDWKIISYTADLSIYVRRLKSLNSGSDYYVCLWDLNTQACVAFLTLDDIKINSTMPQVFYTPTSYVDLKYRGKGLMKALYKWVLDHGLSLVSDKFQSPDSNGLWKKLANEYRIISIP